MKTLKLLLALTFFQSINTYAQIKYEGTVDSKYKTIELEDGTFKYVKYNKMKQEALIYSLDNSLWKTVRLPLPKSHLLDEIKHISQYTFNDDDLVELIYSCVEYKISDELENTHKDYVKLNFTLNIINESGKLILKVENSNEIKIINSKEQKMLLIYKHIGENFNSQNETVIYSF